MNESTETTTATNKTELAHMIVPLLRRVVYRDRDEKLFLQIVAEQIMIDTQLMALGASLCVDETEGYAYVTNRGGDDYSGPKLVQRRQLNYDVSLMLALLRKRLAEHDTHEGATRLVMTRDDIVSMVSVFLPDTPNEASQVDKIEATINKVVELGFLGNMRNADHTYEVRRIIKAFIDAQWLSDFDAQLAAYAARWQPSEGTDKR